MVSYKNLRGQLLVCNFIEKESIDGDREWYQHSWNIREDEDPQFNRQDIPKQVRQKPRVFNQNYQEVKTTFPNQTQFQQHNYNDHPQQYTMQLQHQHMMVSRGPKLHFPEFSGEDCDGWIRKAEKKYFEMVGVPAYYQQFPQSCKG